MTTDKYRNLRYTLMENDEWPLRYMFKFIVPNIDGKVDKVKDVLPPEGVLSYKHTKSLKHISVTCIAFMDSADEIITILENASAIEGVMSL